MAKPKSFSGKCSQTTGRKAGREGGREGKEQKIVISVEWMELVGILTLAVIIICFSLEGRRKW